MSQVKRLQPMHHDRDVRLRAASTEDALDLRSNLAGYILDRSSRLGPMNQQTWGYWVVASAIGEPATDLLSLSCLQGTQNGPTQLRAIGRLIPAAPTSPITTAQAVVSEFRPIRSGQSFRITSPPEQGLVVPPLAEALEQVFERFARDRNFTANTPLNIRLSRGFKAGSHGHGEGRAADIVAVGGKSLLDWKEEWNQAMTAAQPLADSERRALAIAAVQQHNLGYGLYKALQNYGGWRVNPGGWEPYRNVMQLFGPWTATEGPWKAMQIPKPTFYQQQRLADQQWVFHSHQDHIHVAR
jgi:hypothetical protein